MNSIIDTGSIVMVRKLDAYQAGDVISYYVQNEGKEEIVTHRIIREGGNVYVTKGDANQVVDREVVRPGLVIGKAILIIPYLGYYTSFAKGSVGLWLVIILPAVVIVAAELYKIYFELKKNKFDRTESNRLLFRVLRLFTTPFIIFDESETDTKKTI